LVKDGARADYSDAGDIHALEFTEADTGSYPIIVLEGGDGFGDDLGLWIQIADGCLIFLNNEKYREIVVD
jgi:hypothetical protein